MYMAAKAKSFALTIRPLNGFTAETEKRVLAWLQRQDHGIAVIEMDGTPGRHLHAQIWSKSSKTKSSVKTSLQRICKATIPGWDPCQERVLNQGVKFAYNDDFYQEYLLDNDDKPDPVNIIYDDIPGDRTEFYPTKEQQESFKAKTNAVDKKYHHYSELYRNYAKLHGYPVERPKKWMIFEFLGDACCGSKTINVPRDDRTFKATATWLYRYITSNIGDLLTDEMKEQKKVWVSLQ
ncbi:MAG: putative replicase [Circoviridae sp.]|nr:MAG: putative replicase [Circoviridae sp.]